MKNITNPFYPQLTMSDFSKLDSQTVEKCFYLWLIRKNNNDYVGLAKNTNTYIFNPAFLIDNWYYILPSKAKLMLSFDTNFERTPLINKCLQVKIYFYGSRDRFDESYLKKLKVFVGECLWYKFPELSYGEIDFEFHNCDEIFQEYHNVDQLLPIFYQINYVGSDDVTMDLHKERAIHDKFQNCLIKTMKLDHKRRNPFKAKRNSLSNIQNITLILKLRRLMEFLRKMRKIIALFHLTAKRRIIESLGFTLQEKRRLVKHKKLLKKILRKCVKNMIVLSMSITIS